MGFLSSLFGGGDTPQAEESKSEKAEARLLAAMRDSYEQNGIPAERELVAQQIGLRYDPATKTHNFDQNMKRSRFNADGSIRNNITDSGESVSNISQAYERHRPNYDPNMNSNSSEMGDIDQAVDESQAQRQATEADTTDAYNALGNAAGLAHGQQLQSSADVSQLSAQQAEAANFNAANRFASQTNTRGAIGEVAGAGLAGLQRRRAQSQNNNLISAGAG